MRLVVIVTSWVALLLGLAWLVLAGIFRDPAIVGVGCAFIAMALAAMAYRKVLDLEKHLGMGQSMAGPQPQSTQSQQVP